MTTTRGQTHELRRTAAATSASVAVRRWVRAATRQQQQAGWALVCGILGLLCCGLLGIPAIILGRQAAAEGQPGGMAKAGEVLGYVAIGLMVLGAILVIGGVFSFGSN
jgi:hypothetical protein